MENNKRGMRAEVLTKEFFEVNRYKKTSDLAIEMNIPERTIAWYRKKHNIPFVDPNGNVDYENIQKIDDRELLEEINRRGYLTIKKDIKQDQIYKFPDLDETITIGVVSDTHLCSMYQQLTHLEHFYEECAKRGITKVFHAGDVIEGNGRQYRGQLYEMFLQGTSNKVNYAVDHYPEVEDITTYLIGGSHDYCFWRDDGYDVLDAVTSKRKDIEYLGMFGAFLDIGGIKIYLNHGSGGVAYARSYKLQKIIQELAPEQKPHILLLGHYHTPCYLPMYRNVESFQLGCFQAQTPYMKTKGLFPAVQGMFLTIKQNADGLEGIILETMHYYKPIKNDY